MHEHIGSWETRLKQWGMKLDDLSSKIDQTGAQTQSDYRRHMKNLKTKFRLAREKFDEIRSAGASNWNTAKSGLEKAWIDFEDDFKKLNP